MARTVRDVSLETRTARLRLAISGKPYFRLVDQGCHLGYRRNKRGAGVWVGRRFLGERKYAVQRIGLADDVRDADDLDVLSFSQAQARLRAWVAEEARRDAGLEVHSGRPLTVEEAVRDYLSWVSHHRKPSTASEWRYAAEAHILPTLGKRPVAKLKTAELRRWHEALAEQPRRLRTRPGEMQRYREASKDPDAIRARRASANRVLTVLKASVNRAFQEGKVTSDDAWRRLKPFRGVDAARVRYLQEDECRRLLNACGEDFRRLVQGALVTGCRYGELCRAEVRDFNADAARLLIREAKSGKPRWVPLDDHGSALLDGLAAGRRGTEKLFLRADGKPWDKSQQARPLLDACKAARIDPPINFHCLRHTWASHRVMKGMPLLAVAHVLGHSDTRMVEKHYAHLAPSFIHEAVRATAMALEPPTEGMVQRFRAAG